MIEAGQGVYVVAQVDKIHASVPRPLANVKADVLKSWKDKSKADALDRLAAKISGQLKLGESFDKLAKDMGKKVQRSPYVARTAAAEKLKLDHGFIPALFSLTKKGDTTAINTGKTVIVLELAGRRVNVPKDAENQEDIAALKNSMKRSLETDILEQFRMGLFEKYDVTINNDLLQEIYTPQQDG
ncbi:MAG: hypothetical protein OXT65_10815 [Alphaproteobacteria bacterium]|nr:hypothetical protein [Alphaproteobacteria bacterium]